MADDNIPTIRIDKKDIKGINKKFLGAKPAPINPKQQLEEVMSKRRFQFKLDFSQGGLWVALKTSFGFLFQPIITPILILISYFTKKPVNFLEMVRTEDKEFRKDLMNKVKTQTKEEYIAEQEGEKGND